MKAAIFSIALLLLPWTQRFAADPASARQTAAATLLARLSMTWRPLHFWNRAMIAACVAILAFALPTRGKSADAAPTTAPEFEPLTDNSTPADVFESMRRNFNAAAAKGVHAHYQFNLSGPVGGAWWIIVNDGEFTMGKGATDNPDVIMVSTDKDWVMLATGSLSGIRAFLTGRLKVSGDQSLARKLESIFP